MRIFELEESMLKMAVFSDQYHFNQVAALFCILKYSKPQYKDDIRQDKALTYNSERANKVQRGNQVHNISSVCCRKLLITQAKLMF